MELLFHAMSVVVLPFWLPMIFLPRWSWTPRIVRSPWIVLPPVLVYAGLVAFHVGPILGALERPSPESIAGLTGQPWGATLFWTYAAAFDLFVGRWIYLDARERGLSSWWVSPALFVAVFFGPIGFLIHAAARAFHARGRREA